MNKTKIENERLNNTQIAELDTNVETEAKQNIINQKTEVKPNKDNMNK